RGRHVRHLRDRRGDESVQRRRSGNNRIVLSERTNFFARAEGHPCHRLVALNDEVLKEQPWQIVSTSSSTSFPLTRPNTRSPSCTSRSRPSCRRCTGRSRRPRTGGARSWPMKSV